MGISVAIVEDDKYYNNTLKKVLDYYPDLDCVGQFYSGRAALEGLVSTNPDIVMMDMRLKDHMGDYLISVLKPKLPNTNFIVCTNYEDDGKIFDSLKAGATGYLVKGESLEKIVSSIIDAYNGASPMSNSIARKVLNHFRNPKNQMEGLTQTENEIISLLSDGYQYKEIADKKMVSVETVKKHITNIYKKLGVNNKIEAINKFNQK